MIRTIEAGILGLVTGLLGVVICLSPLGTTLEEDLGLQWLFALRGAVEAPSYVVVVALDRRSAAELNLNKAPERWPRGVFAQLVRELSAAGAELIAFDVFFGEMRGAEEDLLFSNALKDAGNVVLTEQIRTERISLSGPGGSPGSRARLEKRVAPAPELASSALALAPFLLPKVPLRVSQFWAFRTETGEEASLPVVMLQAYALGASEDLTRCVARSDPGLVELARLEWTGKETGRRVDVLARRFRVAFRQAPGSAERLLNAAELCPEDPARSKILKSLINMYTGGDSRYLNFYGPPGTITTIPGYELILKDRTADGHKQVSFQGKAVFVGVSELSHPEQVDAYPTVFSLPNGIHMSGVEIAATAFANLLEDRSLRPLPLPAFMATVSSLGMAQGGLAYLLPPFLAAPGLIGFFLLYLFAVLHQFQFSGIWYPTVVPLLFQCPFAFLGAVLWKYIRTHRERENIREGLRYYLPEPVVEHLADRGKDLRKDHDLKYGVCLFTDAAQYTTVSEKMEPRELADFMNRYFEVVFEPVKKYGGSVAEIIGDSILATWIASDPCLLPRSQACYAALEILDAINRFNASRGNLQLPIRIGLHAGPVSFGNVGAGEHFEYRPVGDVVNTASRIEGLNKFLHTQILAADEAIRGVEGLLTRELGTFTLMGKSKPITIHHVICRMEDADEGKISLCNSFARALNAYKTCSLDHAAAHFERLVQNFADGPSAFYRDLCGSRGRQPPREPWDGTIRLEKK